MSHSGALNELYFLVPHTTQRPAFSNPNCGCDQTVSSLSFISMQMTVSLSIFLAQVPFHHISLTSVFPRLSTAPRLALSQQMCGSRRQRHVYFACPIWHIPPLPMHIVVMRGDNRSVACLCLCSIGIVTSAFPRTRQGVALGFNFPPRLDAFDWLRERNKGGNIHVVCISLVCNQLYLRVFQWYLCSGAN